MHTAGAQGSLQNTDVLVQGGRIAAIGTGLAAGDAPVIEANGRPLTPTLFGGVTGIGIEEVSGESGTRDDRLALGPTLHHYRIVWSGTLLEALQQGLLRIGGIGLTVGEMAVVRVLQGWPSGVARARMQPARCK